MRRKIICENCESKFEVDEDILKESQNYDCQTHTIDDTVGSVYELGHDYFKNCPKLKKYENYTYIGEFTYASSTYRCPFCDKVIDLGEDETCNITIFDENMFGDKNVSLSVVYDLEQERLISKNPNFKILRVLCEKYDESFFDDEM